MLEIINLAEAKAQPAKLVERAAAGAAGRLDFKDGPFPKSLTLAKAA